MNNDSRKNQRLAAAVQLLMASEVSDGGDVPTSGDIHDPKFQASLRLARESLCNHIAGRKAGRHWIRLTEKGKAIGKALQAIVDDE